MTDFREQLKSLNVDLDRQWDALETQRQAARQAGDPLGEARALSEMAAILLALKRPSEARAHLLWALDLYRRAGEKLEQGKVRYALALVLGQAGEQPSEIETNLRLALEVFVAESAHVLKGKTRAHLATMAILRKDLRDADEQIHQAGLAFADAGETGLVLESLRYRTIVLQLQGRMKDAHVCLSRALGIARKLGAEYLSLQIRLDLHNLAASNLVSEDLQPESLETIFNDAQKAGQPGLAGHARLAAIPARYQAGDLPGALRMAQEARAIALRVADPLLYTLSCLAISEVAELMGNRLETLNILFTCQASLADLLGEEARIPVLQFLDAVRRRWGEEAYQKEMVRYRAQFDN